MEIGKFGNPSVSQNWAVATYPPAPLEGIGTIGANNECCTAPDSWNVEGGKLQEEGSSKLEVAGA